MKDDKDVSNDNKMAAMFTLRWLATKERLGRLFPPHERRHACTVRM